MIKAILVGSGGKMGAYVHKAAIDDGGIEIVAGVDKVNTGQTFPVFSKFSDITAEADVIIDFSNPVLLDDMLSFAISKQIPVVIATTGYSEAQIEKIKATAEKIPVFFTFNMSIGVNLICSLAKKAANILGEGFDIEIIEKHHNQKIDAPSVQL